MESESLIDQFLELLEMTPDDELAHYGLAAEYMKVGRFEDATTSLKRVIEIKPGYAAAYRELGKSLEKSGRDKEAREFFLKGRQLAEGHGDGQMVKEIDMYLRRMEKKQSE